MSLTLIDRPQMRVAATPHRGSYTRIAGAFARLHALAGPAGLLRPGAEMVALYHDDPEETAEPDLHSDAGITVAEGVPIPDELAEVIVPAGRYASITHVGPYEQLGPAWARLKDALVRNGIHARPAASYEIYRNNPTNARPEELRTELFAPVADDAGL